MTSEEREKILDVISTADGGCSTCIAGLLYALRANLPGEPWPAELSYEEARERRYRADAAELPGEESKG